MVPMESMWCKVVFLKESAFSLRLAKLPGNWPPSHKWLMANALEDCNFELGQDLIDEEKERQATASHRAICQTRGDCLLVQKFQGFNCCCC